MRTPDVWVNHSERGRSERVILPSRGEVARASEYIGWAYNSCWQTALDLYREKYGDEPNFAVDAPDGGLLSAVEYLDKALTAIEGSGK